MTIKQKQCLLYYLGYYIGKIDGIWGDQSRDATILFQDDYGLPVNGVCDDVTEKAMKHAVTYGMPEKKTDIWKETKYFRRDEFRCKCGKHCNGFPVEPNEKLVETLETIREHFGVPVTVSSGIRCKTHNTNVGGASKSQHMEGTAADIVVKGVPVSEVVKYAETLMPKTGGIGTYKTFTHIDVRSVRARWNG